MSSVTFNTAQDVYFPKFKPRECGYWKKLSIEEVHQLSHSNVLRMIACNNPPAGPLAICDAGSNTDKWMLTGLAVHEPEKVSNKFSITGDNLFSSKEICHVVNNPSPALEKCDKMIFENLEPMPKYTEDEEVVTLYHATDLSRLQDTVEHGLSTHFGVGCIDTSAIYGCPVPLGYTSTVEPTWSNIQSDECMLVLFASEQNAVFKRDTQRGFINPGADLHIKHIMCKPVIKSAPDNTEVEADKWTPVYCEECEVWTNGAEQWERHLLARHSEKNTRKTEKKTPGENNDVETGGTSRASNDADAAGQQILNRGQSEQVGSGATNDGDTRHNTEMHGLANQSAHIEHMLNVSNEKREKHADDHPPVESLNPWLPRGTVRAIGSFTMFVFTYFKGEMWVLIHKMNKTKDTENVMVSEGGSIGHEAGKARKKKLREEIVSSAEQARMLLDSSASRFLRWQMSKSTGHCLTKKAKSSIVLRSSHYDSYYGHNSRIHYTYYTKCERDFLPDLPKLARCDGHGYERGWAFKESYQQKQRKGQMLPCDNETHAWWRAEDLYRDISEDTERKHFHFRYKIQDPTMSFSASSIALPTLLDLSLSAGILFITVWFFFLQSPFLFNRLGRQRFVPIMMQITQLYFKVITMLNVAVFALSFVRVQLHAQTVAAGFALFATLINHFIIVPKALQAGRSSMKERVDNDDTSKVKDFVIDGGAKHSTKVWHQTVVAFVFAMVGGHVLHVLLV